MNDSTIRAEVARQLETIRAGTEEILPEAEFVRKLERAVSSGKPLRVKQGFDPTAPDIHLNRENRDREPGIFKKLIH
jgi:tyrosyl-tRNA synthetase